MISPQNDEEIPTNGFTIANITTDSYLNELTEI